MQKDFDKWNILKKKLDESGAKPPLVKERDIWWACVGENIGSEVRGKSDLFSRPVIVLKKLAHGFYFVIPTTTRIREGSWYVRFSHGGYEMAACLHQARVIDHRRLSTKIGTLDTDDFALVANGFAKLHIK